MVAMIEFVVHVFGWTCVGLFLVVFFWMAAHEIAGVLRRRFPDGVRHRLFPAPRVTGAKVTSLERYRVRRGWQPLPDRRAR